MGNDIERGRREENRGITHGFLRYLGEGLLSNIPFRREDDSRMLTATILHEGAYYSVTYIPIVPESHQIRVDEVLTSPLNGDRHNGRSMKLVWNEYEEWKDEPLGETDVSGLFSFNPDGRTSHPVDMLDTSQEAFWWQRFCALSSVDVWHEYEGYFSGITGE